MIGDVKSELIIKLVAIAPHVTAQDRKRVMVKFRTNKTDLSQLLNGYVTNVDKGLDILEFLHQKITERQKRLEAVETKVA